MSRKKEYVPPILPGDRVSFGTEAGAEGVVWSVNGSYCMVRTLRWELVAAHACTLIHYPTPRMIKLATLAYQDKWEEHEFRNRRGIPSDEDTRYTVPIHVELGTFD